MYIYLFLKIKVARKLNLVGHWVLHNFFCIPVKEYFSISFDESLYLEVSVTSMFLLELETKAVVAD